MTRGGRPVERRKSEPPERHLLGPRVLLERIVGAGGVPASVVQSEGHSQSAATKNAAAAVAAFTEKVIEQVNASNVDSVRRGPSDDPNRQTAWMLSVLTSLKESVPRKAWCRHLRAADPRVSEIRSVAVPKAGIWKCFVCFGQSSREELSADLWPTECDLCGAATEQFNAILGDIPGCQVELHACDDCAAFLKQPGSPGQSKP
jgi:hypothetical protein